MTTEKLSLWTRLWFAWVCLIRVLFDGAFAFRAFRAGSTSPELAPPPGALPPSAPSAEPEVSMETFEPTPTEDGRTKATALCPEGPDAGPALQLLALFQREGRLVDFLEQDIAAFSDADVGAAARVVHEGCRRALHAHAKLAPVREEPENASVELKDGFAPTEIKLSGDVRGPAPYRGTLRHRGWRVTGIELPTPLADHDPKILAPAEVEL